MKSDYLAIGFYDAFRYGLATALKMITLGARL